MLNELVFTKKKRSHRNVNFKNYVFLLNILLSNYKRPFVKMSELKICTTDFVNIHVNEKDNTVH